MESVLLDAAGHRRSPAPMPGYHRGRPPRNKGEQYPADPPTVEKIIPVMRVVGDRSDGHRLRALIVLLWRAGLRISEALALQESDLDRNRGAVLVRRGKGGKRREVGRTAGRGNRSTRGSRSAASFPSAGCCASSTGRPQDGAGRHQRPASSSITRPPRPVSGAG
jgi:integrase